MTTRLAYSYVRILLVFEVLLFAFSLLLHVGEFIVGVDGYEQCGTVLFRAVVLVGLCGSAFIKDSLEWVEQIRTCPKWMWMAALILGVYSILIAVLHLVGFHFALVLSGFPMAFEASGCCILWSVLRQPIFTDSQVVRRARNSVLFVSFVAVMFVAYRAGYLPPHSASRAQGLPQ
jgi:hypothetical protein